MRRRGISHIRAQEPGLHLIETGSVLLPFEPTHAAVADRNGALLLWANERPGLLLFDSIGVHQVGIAAGHRIVAAGFVGDTALIVFDQDRGVVTILREAEIVRPAPRDYYPTAGAYLSSGWVLGATESGGDYVVSVLAQKNSPAEILRLKRTMAADGAPLSAHISSLGNGYVIITLFLEPFRSYLLNSAGNLVARFEPELPERGGKWVSLPVVRVGRCFLQTLSDLTSDARRIVLFDERGRLMRTSELMAPIGFVGARPSQYTVYAVRDAGGPHLVTYTISMTGATARDCGR